TSSLIRRTALPRMDHKPRTTVGGSFPMPVTRVSRTVNRVARPAKSSLLPEAPPVPATRWAGIVRPYRGEDVEQLKNTVKIENSEARKGVTQNGRANGHKNGDGRANGHQNGHGRANGTNANGSTASGSTANGEAADRRYWLAPIVADAEAGFGGPLNAFELMRAMIEAGAAAVHFEDQLSSEKKCGHLGGKVLVPTSHF